MQGDDDHVLVEHGAGLVTAARRLHLMRLFSCLFLVRAATADGMPVNALTPLVESAVELGPDAVAPASRFVAWCRVNEPGDWRDDPTSRPNLTLALVVLRTQLPQPPTPDPLPGLLASFVEELAVALTEENLFWSPRPIPALLKRTAMAESRRAWVSLAQRCLVDGPAPSTGRGLVTDYSVTSRSKRVPLDQQLRRHRTNRCCWPSPGSTPRSVALDRKTTRLPLAEVAPSKL
jgi:hypothetical protein